MKNGPTMKSARGSLSIRQKKEAMNVFELYLQEAAQRNGFGSSMDYLDSLSKRVCFPSSQTFREALIRQYINTPQVHKSSLNDKAWSNLLRTLKLKSTARKVAPGCIKLKNRILSSLICQRLEALGRNQAWLARQLGVSRETVRQYVLGLTYPKKTLRTQLERILNIKAGELDALAAKKAKVGR